MFNDMMNIRQRCSEHLMNIKGWRTKRHILVIESDDWGSIRMPSKKVYDDLLKNNIRVDKCPFCTFDSLESEDDLTSMFEVLESFTDKHDKHPVISANYVVANPDFLRISESGFKDYFYEPFTETLKKYPNHNDVFSTQYQGFTAGLFHPQLHGREHLNVKRWIKALIGGSQETHLAFRHNMFGISSNISSENRKSYMAAFDADCEEEILSQKEIIHEAVDLFFKIFNYSPSTFVAPNYIWSPHLEQFLFENSIKNIKSSKIQISPDLKSGYTRYRHYTGQTNKLRQIYTVRNCLFEPTLFQNADNVSACLRQIKTAYTWGRPAVIGSHRLNFIGSLNEWNRKSNLRLLSDLLKKVQKEWPNVEFLNSEQLFHLILNDR